MKFILTGRSKTYSGNPDISLLNYLRGEEHIISVKDGCSPQAACGACTVELNGRAILSCVTPMSRVANGNVITTEGMERLVKNAFIVAFAEKGAVQCGFCTPGIVMRARTLLNKNPNPKRQEIIQALKYHLCRCTGYIKIIEAIEYAAELIRNREFKEINPTDGKVGTRHIRYDVQKIIMGNRPFVADLFFDNMSFGVLKFSDHPRAEIVAINTSSAEKLAGVQRI
ncbi:MAG: 2Fe-2S iron-sulfur cluster-binding protein, partial [Anaerolineales bacterium]